MKIVYFTRKALHSLLESRNIAVLTSFTIALALIVIGTYCLIVMNIGQFTADWGRSATVVAYLDDHVSQDQWPIIQQAVQDIPQVEAAHIVSSEDALSSFRNRSPEAKQLVEGLSAKILPTSLQIILTQESTQFSALKKVSKKINALPSIASVDYGESELTRIKQLIDILMLGGLIGGSFLAFATILIISNTVRLTVYSRREEIEILQLVGATRKFIKLPFLLEGCLWGALAGAIACLFFWTSHNLFAPKLSTKLIEYFGAIQLEFYSPELCAYLTLGGVIFGGVGSFIAANQYLRSVNSPC